MSKFACLCGYVMNLSHGTPTFEYSLILESRIEKIAEKLEEFENLNSEMFFELVDEARSTVYRCPSCGRFHVDGGNGLFNSFVPERLD